MSWCAGQHGIMSSIRSLVRRYPCELFDAHQVLSGLINFWSIIRFAGTWRLARSLTIPQAEAAVCHCNFMLIEWGELFKISFLLPFYFSSLSPCPFFLFFHFYTNKFKFSPNAKWNIIINNSFHLWQTCCYKKRFRENSWRTTTARRLWCILKKHNVLLLVLKETEVLPGGQVPNNTA